MSGETELGGRATSLDASNASSSSSSSSRSSSSRSSSSSSSSSSSGTIVAYRWFTRAAASPLVVDDDRFDGSTRRRVASESSAATKGASPASPGAHRTRATNLENGFIPGTVTTSYTFGFPGSHRERWAPGGGYIASRNDRSAPSRKVALRLKPSCAANRSIADHTPRCAGNLAPAYHTPTTGTSKARGSTSAMGTRRLAASRVRKPLAHSSTSGPPGRLVDAILLDRFSASAFHRRCKRSRSQARGTGATPREVSIGVSLNTTFGSCIAAVTARSSASSSALPGTQLSSALPTSAAAACMGSTAAGRNPTRLEHLA